MRRWLTVGIGVLLCQVGVVDAVQVVPLSADELAQRADVIFVGTCQDRVAKTVPLAMTEYTFKINTWVKGEAPEGGSFVVRQRSGSSQPSKPLMSPVLWRMPEYDVGKVYMLFLSPAGKDNLRYPVGGGQGVLTVTPAADGSATVIQQELNNRFLAPTSPSVQVPAAAGVDKSVLPQSRPGTTLQLKEFIQSIRKGGAAGGPP